MTFAYMRAIDNDSLICDFAEYYKIYDMSQFDVGYISILADGLPEDSRIKTKISGRNHPLNTLLNAMSVDALNLLVWMKTEDATKNENRPKSVLEKLMGIEEQGENELFDSADDFNRKRAELLGKG